METRRKCISIMVPTYNEEENVVPLCEAIRAEFAASLPQYDYDILFIDNCSTDKTRALLEGLCATYPNVRAIFNARNFGQFNSPYYGICQTTGDCTIPLCADFQDPIEMIPQLVAKWEVGYKVVCAVKTASRENKLVRLLRTCYYKMIRRMSSVDQIEHFTGFGLYDRSFVNVMRELDDPAPFLRGVIAELGFARTEIPYVQAKRRAGKTHNNWGTLYDAAWQSFSTYTKAPIRFFTLLGAFILGASVLGAIALLVLTLTDVLFNPLLWVVPLVAFFGGLNLVAVGVLGEFVLTLRTKVTRRPLVIEERRVGFDDKE